MGITTAEHPSPPETIHIDVGRIMERVRAASEGIVKIGTLIDEMQARASPDATTTEWSQVAAPMLHDYQQDLFYQLHQMTTYAAVMNPDSVEYHTAQANATHAIAIAEIYLSSNGQPSKPQYAPSSHLPAAILTPVTTPSGPLTINRHVSSGTNSVEPLTLEVITTTDDTVMQDDLSSNAPTNDNHVGMITDDVSFLELSIGDGTTVQ